MSELSTRVRLRREELGLSQEQLAQRMGYRSKSSITKLEKGVNDIPQAKLEELAAALETTPAYLLGLDVPCPPPGFEPLPAMAMVPLVGSSRKFMQRTVVDLPEPDGPMITSFSPSATSRFTSLRTCRSPKYLSTCSSLITVIPAFPYPVLSSVLQRHGQRILCGFPEPHTKTKKQKRRKVNTST